MKFTLILFALPISLFSQSLQHDLDSLLKQVFQPDQAGGALLVMQQDKIIYNNAIGIRASDSKKPLNSRSNFRMASVSKQFTAAAILLLEKQGKLSLNDHIIKFFPDFTSVGKTITIQHLLTHSSGIWDYESELPDTLQTPLSDTDVMNLIKNINHTYFPPGTAFRYSNSAYCLLALIVEKVSGQSFAIFLKEQIFAPLGMKQTIVYEFNTPIKNRAYGYARDDQQQLIPSDQSLTSATKGDGGVYTSLHDYQKWHQALLQNKLFDLEKLLTQTNAPLGLF
jgi:CubicO group peptidase (beta-lactamase class C family)